MVAKDYRANARNAIKPQIKMVLLITLIYEVICTLISLIPFVGVTISILCQGPLLVGYSLFAIKLIRRKSLMIDNIFEGFKNFLNTFLLHFLNAIFIFLWSLLLFVPGIMKAYSYSMSYFIIADNPGMDQGEARKRSMELMNGHRMDLFVLHLSFIGWAILGGIFISLITTPFYYLAQDNPMVYSMIISCLGIIPSLFLLPYITTATANFYNELVGGHHSSSDGVAYIDDGFVIKQGDYDVDELTDRKN